MVGATWFKQCGLVWGWICCFWLVCTKRSGSRCSRRFRTIGKSREPIYSVKYRSITHRNMIRIWKQEEKKVRFVIQIIHYSVWLNIRKRYIHLSTCRVHNLIVVLNHDITQRNIGGQQTVCNSNRKIIWKYCHYWW